MPAGRKVPEMPKYRQNCRNKDHCRKKTCLFTQPDQRSFYKNSSINKLRDYVSLDNCGRPEHGGI
jgi:hypothetical protein